MIVWVHLKLQHTLHGGKRHTASARGITQRAKTVEQRFTHTAYMSQLRKKQRNLLKNLVFTDKQDLYSNKALSADIQVSDILNTAFYEQSLTAAPSRIQDFLGLLVVYKLITHFWMLMELSNVTN